MSGFGLKRLTGLMLALLLAAPAALCGDCCCSTTAVTQAATSQQQTAAKAHGCCPSKAPGAVVEAADSNCGCAEAASAETMPPASATRSETQHAGEPFGLTAADSTTVDRAPLVSDRLRLEASRPPSTRVRSRATPRAPPVLS